MYKSPWWVRISYCQCWPSLRLSADPSWTQAQAQAQALITGSNHISTQNGNFSIDMISSSNWITKIRGPTWSWTPKIRTRFRGFGTVRFPHKAILVCTFRQWVGFFHLMELRLTIGLAIEELSALLRISKSYNLQIYQFFNFEHG